jgi:signal recognition particle receptor subunit beta/predicted  nucleic acid-binding Zn-ribbon protein
MVVYNAASRELTAKIVYYGPGLSGKTTNLQFLHRKLEPASVGNLLTLAATAERTIFFDILPVELGDLKGYRIRFQVATVPGQSPYNETRRLVLRGADGVVFVVDSRWSMLPKNLESLQNLRENLQVEGLSFDGLPFVVQFNKRDLPDVLAVDALQEALGLSAHPFVEAVAAEGKGVVETFKLISKLTFVDIVKRLQRREIPRRADAPAADFVPWKPPAPARAAPPAEPEPAPAGPAAVESLESPFEEEGPPDERGAPVSEATHPAFFESRREPDIPPIAVEEPYAAASVEPPEPPDALELAEEEELEPAQEVADLEPIEYAEEAASVDAEPAPSGPTLAERVLATDRAVADLVETFSRLEDADRERGEEVAGLREGLESMRRDLRDSVAAAEGLEPKARRLEEGLDDLRREWGSARRETQEALQQLREEAAAGRRDLAEASSREMEIVAQINREAASARATGEQAEARFSELGRALESARAERDARLDRAQKSLEDWGRLHEEERVRWTRRFSEIDAAIADLRDESRRRSDAHDELRETMAAALDELVDRIRRTAERPSDG